MTITMAGSKVRGCLTTRGRPSEKGLSPSLPQKRDADVGSLLPSGHRGAASSSACYHRGLNRASNVDNATTADAIIAAAVNADSGVAVNNIAAAISSDLQGISPPC